MIRLIIRRRYLLPALIAIIYIALTIINPRSIINLSSSDEEYFTETNFLEEFQSHELRYIIWGTYVSTLETALPGLFIYIQILLSVALLTKAASIKSINPSFLVFFLFPTVIYYHHTYLRDILSMQIVAAIILIWKEKQKLPKLQALALTATLIAIKPAYGIAVGTCIVIANTKIIKTRSITYITILASLILSLTIAANTEAFNNYRNLISTYEKSTDQFGLLGINRHQATPPEAAITALLNHLAFWTIGLNPKEASPQRIILFLEAALIIFAAFACLKSIRNIDQELVKKFAAILIFASIPLSIHESSEATAMRHRFMFLPALFFLATSSNKSIKINPDAKINLHRRLPIS